MHQSNTAVATEAYSVLAFSRDNNLDVKLDYTQRLYTSNDFQCFDAVGWAAGRACRVATLSTK